MGNEGGVNHHLTHIGNLIEISTNDHSCDKLYLSFLFFDRFVNVILMFEMFNVVTSYGHNEKV